MCWQQAAANTKEQFAACPDLRREITSATIEGIENPQAIGKQILGNEGNQREFAKIIAGFLYGLFARQQQKSNVA